jgi:hypothetical protein
MAVGRVHLGGGHDLFPPVREFWRARAVVAIIVGKSSDGTVQAFGSGTFGPLSDFHKNLAERLVK